MVEEKCTCDYCGMKVGIQAALVSDWSHTEFKFGLQPRPAATGQGPNTSIFSKDNVCKACGDRIMEAVKKALERIKKK